MGGVTGKRLPSCSPRAILFLRASPPFPVYYCVSGTSMPAQRYSHSIYIPYLKSSRGEGGVERFELSPHGLGFPCSILLNYTPIAFQVHVVPVVHVQSTLANARMQGLKISWRGMDSNHRFNASKALLLTARSPRHVAEMKWET